MVIVKNMSKNRKALQTNARKDYLFALKQEFETYNQLQDKIEKCDQEIKTMLDKNIDSDNNKNIIILIKKHA